MIPLIFTIALGFISFFSSAFVILRIVIPILPPHPLSRRVAPSEFGLPNYNFRSLTSADKSHLWLASFDLLALCVFIWQAASEYSGGATGFADARDACSAARLWFALTIRQTCLLVVSGLTLVHIRMGRSVSFGRKHWMIWGPTLLLSLASTTLAAVFAGAGISTLFAGVAAYSTIHAVLSTAAFGGLVYTLIVIKRNLAALNEPTDTWPPVKEVERKHRPSFATEDIDALREGSSWLTSDAASSRHESMSNWSFSTHHAGQVSARTSPAASQSGSQSKSVHWFSPSTTGVDASIPPVPPLPSVYRGNTPQARVVDEDPDPFRRDVPNRPRLGSQSSWLSSPAVSHATMSAWSYPITSGNGSDIDANAGLLPQAQPSRPATPMTSVVDLNAALLPQLGPSSRPATPALSSANVLGGYGYTADSEKGIASLAVTGSEVDISYSRYVFWLLSIWVPFILSLPHLVSLASLGSAPTAFSIMLVLSVTSSSPLLALNILIRSPIPIPTGLFGVHVEPPSAVMRAPSPSETLATYCREYKRSGSMTVVEGRRSGDIWISQGDAVEGKGKLGRALGLMSPLPRLAVLPPEEEVQDGETTPPLPMQEESLDNTVTPSRQSANSVEFGRVRTESKASCFSGDEGFATRIMIAQRHYSAVATTVVVPASPERKESQDGFLTVATGVDVVPPIPTVSSHLRSRSISSIGERTETAVSSDVSAPPSQPLPPTPPNIRSAKQTAKHLLHRKSRSSDFSFGATINDDIKEIDVLTAGVLPLLVPGLQIGDEIKIRDWDEFSPAFSSTVTKKKRARMSRIAAESEFRVLGLENFATPLCHSTPLQGRQVPGHKRNHLSLPSLGLNKNSVYPWENDLNQELAMKTGKSVTLSAGDTDRRNTLWGSESVANAIANPMTESKAQHAVLNRSASSRKMNIQIEIPEPTDNTRTSIATLILPPGAVGDARGVFEPSAESTPYEAKNGYSGGRKHQAGAMAQNTGSHRSSIVYIKSDDKLLKSVTPVEPSASLTTRAHPLRKSIISRGNTLLPKLSMSEKQLDPHGGLRPLSLLKDRDSNKEENAFKFAGTRPLVLGKKQVLKVTRSDAENMDPNAGDKRLKPLRLGRSDSSKLRAKLRRNEVLPTVVVRPPSSNSKIGTSCEYR